MWALEPWCGPHADRLLILVALCLAAYVFLPALAISAPAWLVRTTFARAGAALAPLAAAGITGRLRGRPQGEAGGGSLE